VTRFADPEQLDQLAQAEVAKAKADAQMALELLNDEESLVAVGLTEEEARKRIQRRQQRAEAMDERLTGITGREEDDEGEAA
jgi:hypothetical protein